MASVHAVILAGGSGTRFWPASRRTSPKQLLPLGPGEGVLIAETLKRLAPVCPAERVLISTGRHVLDATRSALPELEHSAFLAEPVAKNTAPCIGWATARVFKSDPEALVIVVPSDQFIADENGYVAALEIALRSAEAGSITTLGIRPTRPETGYGYIEAGDVSEHGVASVRRFVEKPTLAKAEEYLNDGNYYWNAGMFVFKARVMLEEMARSMPELHAGLMEIVAAPDLTAEEAIVERVFASAEKISIDYGVMEKARALSVVPADIGWSDLGSFQVAWELANKDAHDNVAPEHAVLIDAKGNLIMDLRTGAHQDRTIALVGVSDMCVVQTDDALLMIPRDLCQDVRKVVDHLNESGKGSFT